MTVYGCVVSYELLELLIAHGDKAAAYVLRHYADWTWSFSRGLYNVTCPEWGTVIEIRMDARGHYSRGIE